MASNTDPSSGLRFRLVLTASAFSQIYAYSALVVWSLFAQVNLALTIAVSFISTVSIAVVLTAGELIKGVRGWRRFPGGRTRAFVSFIGLVPQIFFAGYGAVLIAQVVSLVDLHQLDWQIRFFAFVGILSLLGFTAITIDELLKVRGQRRIGELPRVAPSQESRVSTNGTDGLSTQERAEAS